MGRSIGIVLALALAAPAIRLPAPSRAIDRDLPMRFELYREGPEKICGTHCRTLVSASGSITADTARAFSRFAQGRDLSGALVVLDSDGGSVHGAMALGRAIRKLGLDTTVGLAVALDDDAGAARAKLTARADCESMCAFVLLAGVHRFVPEGARVMVHQIWLGDRRDDPTAGSYSAEDLVLVQRDIGKLAQYTIEMGASIDVLDIALRIPPWEPMHTLTSAEIRNSRVATAEPDKTDATVAASPPQRAQPAAPMGDNLRPAAISEKQWAVVDRAGTAALARSHPLTVEGEEIGRFDLIVSCGAAADSYDVRYVEHRRAGERAAMPQALNDVKMTVRAGSATLKVTSSERRGEADEWVTYAAGAVPAALIDAFAAAGAHSMMIETKTGHTVTGIRLGNTGAQQNLPRLTAVCAKPRADRAADLSARKAAVAAK